MNLVSLWVGKILISLMRLRGSGGSALPGLAIERINSGLLEYLSAQLRDGVVMVAGTNGKTTTTKVITGIMHDQGLRVLTNRAGSNMTRGVLSSLAEAADWSGRLAYDLAVLEVDEGFIPDLSRRLKPRVLCVLNLHRDQLDRYHELARTQRLLAEGAGHAEVVVLNADDGMVAELGSDVKLAKYFGLSDALRKQMPDDQALLGDSGIHAHRNVTPAVLLKKFSTNGEKSQLTISVSDKDCHGTVQLPGLYNGVNVMAAVTVAAELGVNPAGALKAAGKVKPAFGRSEVLKMDGKELQLFLVKNPAGFNQVVHTFLKQRDNEPVLMVLNDLIADGRDVSWIWDARFDELRGRKQDIDTAGIRGHDMALRLKYAELPTGWTETEISVALARFGSQIEDGQRGTVVATYTAMRSVRKLLRAEARAAEEWES